jgi:hypothetical protein
MAQRQINGRVPEFMWQEWDDLRVELRKLGSKPTDGDLIAALVHAALDSLIETKAKVEKYELAVEEAGE